MYPWAGKRQPVPYRDWHRAASAEERTEYDAFGPWIDPIRGESEMPRRFRDAYAEHRDARFLLKVPIGADRLQVRPGMDLYKMVLAVHDDRLSLIRLVENEVAQRTIGWNDVAAIRSHTNLLFANWSLLLRDGGTISFDYSAVSSRRLDKVTDFIRAQLTRRLARTDVGPLGASVAVADLFFQNMLMAVRASSTGPVVPIHFEPRDRPCRTAENRRRLTTGLLILEAPDEIIIVDRELPFRRRFHPTYAARTTFIPTAMLTSFSLVPPPPESRLRFHQLRLVIDRQTIDQPCLVSPDRVMACLARHGVSQAVNRAE